LACSADSCPTIHVGHHEPEADGFFQMSSDVLVIDVGSSSLRAVVMRADATLHHTQRKPIEVVAPFPGAVEFDALAVANAALDAATECLAISGPVGAVGIAAQRASTILWDRVTGIPVGPAIGWQDIRTAGICLMHQPQFNFAPNQSATKLSFLLDVHDHDRARAASGQLLFGTVETWIAWKLSNGALHITDASNAAVTGLTALVAEGGVEWSADVLRALNIPSVILPTIVDSTGTLGVLHALPSEPLLGGLIGDQQASMIGQGVIRPGIAKITFGTGGMLDTVVDTPPTLAERGPHGTFPIVGWRQNNTCVWGTEAIMLSAGTSVRWLCDDLGMLTNAAESELVAASCSDTGGVVFVPALLGLGTPAWDFGARGTLLGVTRGTGKAELVRAVLEGVAHRAADLVDAANHDTGTTIRTLRIDGGMTANRVFVQAVANATQLPVEVSPELEATALGAGYLAGVASGVWSGVQDSEVGWKPREVVTPTAASDRTQWQRAVKRAEEWLPDLSALKF
jgi:glycerol kinase